MKKILLLSLVWLSPQIFAADIDLQCKRQGYEVHFQFIELRDSATPNRGHAKFQEVLFDNSGKIRYLGVPLSRETKWLDTSILIWGSLNGTYGTIDRGTLELAAGYDPFDRLKYDCEVIDNLEAKLKRWREEKEAKEKAEKEAKKAKNVI